MFVPRDILGFFAADSTAPPGLRRQLVAACVLGGGGADGEWLQVSGVLRRADDAWDTSQARERPGHVTVLSALLELQVLGVVAEVEQAPGGFLVRLNAREHAA